jgi:hypothetical protein
MYTLKPFEYCTAAGESNNGNLYLNQVDVAGMNNTSGNDAYTYYQDSLVELELNGSYTISLTANVNWSENDMGAWIDYNNDAVFDASELIIADTNTGNFSTSNFTVPANAVIGDTVRMRIRLGYWDNPVFDPCETTLGEVEDYPVLILDSCDVMSTTDVTACDIYNWNGTDYTASGSYNWTGTNAAGCDSIANLNLTIETASVSVSVQDVTLTATTASGTLQWVDCINGYSIIPNETGTSYSPTLNGEYAVIVTDGNCVDTSNCVVINTIGLQSLELPGLRIYPNPSNGQFTIDLGTELDRVQIRIEDVRGRIIYNETHISSSKILIEEEIDSGAYFIKIDDGNLVNVKVIVID